MQTNMIPLDCFFCSRYNYGMSTLVFLCIDMRTGVIGNMVELGITESYKVKLQVLLSAAEAAEMILRVDDIIKAAPR